MKNTTSKRKTVLHETISTEHCMNLMNKLEEIIQLKHQKKDPNKLNRASET